MQPYLRYSVRGLTKRPIRAFFIIFMIVTGVMLMCGTRIALNSIPAMVEASVEEANMADFSLNFRPLPKTLVDLICNDTEGIEEYELRIVFKTTAYRIKGWPASTEILLIGVEDHLNLNKVVMVNGRFFEGDENSIIIEHDYGENVFEKDILVEMPTGNVTLEVVGTCRAVWMPRWAVSSTAYAMVPLKVLQNFLNINGSVNQVLIKVSAGLEPTAVMNSLSRKFEQYGPVIKSIEGTVMPFVETQSYYNYLVGLLSLIGYSLFAVGLVLLYSSLSFMVTQEYREIGTLKAFGATQKNIVTAYIVRSLLLGSIGSSTGVFLSVLVANGLIGGFTSVSLNFEGTVFATVSLMQMIQENKEILLLYGGLGTLLSLILVFPSALSASKVSASHAIRSFTGMPAQMNGSKSRLQHSPLFLKYAFRSLARKKWREMVVVLVIFISVSVNSTLIAASDSQKGILEETSNALRFDFFICLSTRSNSTLLDEKLSFFTKNVTFMEFAYYTTAKIEGYTFFLIGSPANAPYFRYSLVSGRWLQENESGAVLTESLIRILKVKVGDTLTLSNDVNQINVTVVGIRRDLVLNVPIVSLTSLQSLDNAEGKINAIVVEVKKDVNLDRIILDIRRNVPNYLWHIKKEGLVDIGEDILAKAFQSTATAMITFTWLTSILLIFSVVGQNINEEKMVITTLRALGMNRGRCILIIVLKIMLLGLAAALLCALFTPFILEVFSIFLSKTTNFSIHIRPSANIILTSAFFILATTLPSSLSLGIYATGISIVENLRYE
ncbi:MAG: FtsX-like permease family protein [Candidatus Bathyarchaeia archaeon]